MKNSLIKSIEVQLNDKVIEQTSSGVLIMLSGLKYFMKSSRVSDANQCELNGLKELIKAKAIAVVKPVLATQDYIITEFVEQKSPKANFYRDMGMQLAKMHQYRSAAYGFYEDNFIGSTTQLKRPSKAEATSWIEFYFNKRLVYQFNLAQKNGASSKRLKEAFNRLPNILSDIIGGSEELPSLLHGDLWSGNYLCNEKNEPVLIDPAVYYGHRETDLAMTRLFGGFSQDFYDSYEQVYPLKEGWQERIPIYQLYHVLNHYNMFGGVYLVEAENLMKIYM